MLKPDGELFESQPESANIAPGTLDVIKHMPKTVKKTVVLNDETLGSKEKLMLEKA